jgi:hypothetical protein
VPLEDGYWLLDLAPTKTHCVLNAFVTWIQCRKGRLCDVIGWTTRKSGKYVRKIILHTDKYRVKGLLNMTQMQEIMSHEMRVTSNIDDVTKINIDDLLDRDTAYKKISRCYITWYNSSQETKIMYLRNKHSRH